MKRLLLLLVAFSQFAFAQNFVYPKLNKLTTDIQSVVPLKWKIIDSAIGDLNQDKNDDIALVLEYQHAIAEHRAYGDNDTELIKEVQRPRILAIYFKDNKTKNYQIVLQNNNFILRANEGGELGEPLKNITINDNTLGLSFEGGGAWRWKLNYQFKYNQKSWVLVQANNTYYNPKSGELNDRYYNFVERTTKHTIGNLFNRNAADQVNEEFLYFSQPKTLSTFKKPWTWQITKDNYL